MTDYKFKQGYWPRQITAETAATELEALRAKGPLTAEAVFEAARPKDATLHPEFEWDGKKAIRELGLIRARKLIRAIVVVPEKVDEAEHRVYVHITDDDSGASRHGHYEPMSVVITRPDLFAQALTNLQRKFDAAAEALEELRSAASTDPNAERLAAIGLAVQGFGAVREALAILK